MRNFKEHRIATSAPAILIFHQELQKLRTKDAKLYTACNCDLRAHNLRGDPITDGWLKPDFVRPMSSNTTATTSQISELDGQ
jgi:hypothetical protein